MSRRPFDEAIALGLDTFIDAHLGDPAPDTDALYDGLAQRILDFAADTWVDALDTHSARLYDNTVLQFEPDMIRVPAYLRLSQMLGIEVRLSSLPSPCSRGTMPSITTPTDAALWTWHIDGRTVLRGFNDGAPVLTRGDGTRLYAPADAAAGDGVLLITPDATLTVDRAGAVSLHDHHA